MTTQEIFILSQIALTKIVNQIKDDQWDHKVPDYISDKDLTLRQIINYHAYDDIWVPDTLSGKTIEEVGTKYDGDLLGDDPKKSWHEITDKSIQAVKDLDDPQKIVHLSYGDFSADEYLKHIATFRTFRAVNIARFIGVDDTLDPQLVEGMWDFIEKNAEDLRQMGVFGPKVEVPESAPLQSRLLGLAGYQP